MLILFLLFLIQFSVACACLGVNESQQEQWAEQGWTRCVFIYFFSWVLLWLH